VFPDPEVQISARRTAGLKIAGARGAIILQPLVYAAVLAYLGYETLRLTASVLLASAVVIASMLIPELQTYHYSVLTESLFMSGILGLIACVAGFVRDPSWARASRIGAAAALTATVRQTAVAFLPMAPIVVLMHWRRLPHPRLSTIAAAAAPMLLIVGGERAAARVIHGDRLTSLLGRHMFAKAALIEASDTPAPSVEPERARLDHDLDVMYGPIRRLLESAPPEFRSVLSIFYETCLQGPCVPVLGTTSAAFTDTHMNEQLAAAARARLQRAPSGFVRLAVREYGSLWTAFRLRDPGTAPALTAFVAGHRPLPFEAEAFKVAAGDAILFQGSRAVLFLQPLVMALSWLTAGLAIAGVVSAVARRPLPPPLAVAAVAALVAQSGVVLTAFLAAGIGRFMLSLWPAVMAAALFAAWWAVTLVRDV